MWILPTKKKVHVNDQKVHVNDQKFLQISLEENSVLRINYSNLL